MVEHILQWVETHPGWLFFFIFLAAFLESLALAGVVIPGVALLFGLAMLGADSSLSGLLLSAIAGAIAGDGISYWLGRRYHEEIRGIWPLSRHPELYRKGERFFQRHGGKSVVIGRFVGPIRPLIPLVAGSLNMPPARFFLYNILSALVWGPLYVLPGYLAGMTLKGEARLENKSGWVILAIVTTGILAGLFAHQLHRYFDSRRPATWPHMATLIAALSGGLFVSWSILVFHWPDLRTLDLNFREVLLQTPSWIKEGATALTLLGDPDFLYAMLGAFCAWLWLQGLKREALAYVGGGLLLHLSVYLLKNSLGVERPPGTLYPTSAAYPSGHAAGSLYVWSVILIQTLPLSDRLLARGSMIMGIAAALWIASSRLVLDVHWLSDVIAGALLGTALAASALRLANRRPLRNRDPALAINRLGGKRLALLAGLAAAFYIAYNWTEAKASYHKDPGTVIQTVDQASLSIVPVASASK